jgi:tether containing UBX domain for GLUT4
LEKGRNKRLLSDKEIKEQADAEAAKFASITTVSIKVRFPDNTSATWNMGPRDTGAALYRAIRTLMADSSLAFKLVFPAGKGFILDDDTATLIKGHKLSGGVLVTVYWEDSVPQESRHRPFLKDSAARDAKQVVVPDIPVAEEEEEEKKPVAPNLQAGSSSGDGDKGVGKKLPKWLKLPGKK